MVRKIVRRKVRRIVRKIVYREDIYGSLSAAFYNYK